MKQTSQRTYAKFLRLARCPTCKIGLIQRQKEVMKCTKCKAWYPIADGVLELLPISSSYNEDRIKLWNRIGKRYHLTKDTDKVQRQSPQEIQRHHFDSYAVDDIQSYNMYETMSFWRVIDRIIFESWMKLLPKDAVVLDIGCAQGRSALPFVENIYTVIGFDIAKKMIEVGNSRFKEFANPPVLFVGDATTIPIADNSADVVVLYGVLHHLPNPKQIAKEIARVLKPNGLFLSLENNRTPFRFLFDLMQQISCLWHEEAGESPTMSASQVAQWFSNADMKVSTNTHVFIPPHLINLLPVSLGYKVILWSDFVASKIPFIRSWGGLIEIIGRKTIKNSKSKLIQNTN
jgi:ubiquinone/menaquinone biosynthesis C-methylase UbiE/uncharacterized protein YbaR (Trm112 family)